MRWAKKPSGEQYIALRYEDLLAQPWEQMSRLWAFLGVKVDLPDLPEILQTEMGSNPDRSGSSKKPVFWSTR